MSICRMLTRYDSEYQFTASYSVPSSGHSLFLWYVRMWLSLFLSWLRFCAWIDALSHCAQICFVAFRICELRKIIFRGQTIAEARCECALSWMNPLLFSFVRVCAMKIVGTHDDVSLGRGSVALNINAWTASVLYWTKLGKATTLYGTCSFFCFRWFLWKV